MNGRIVRTTSLPARDADPGSESSLRNEAFVARCDGAASPQSRPDLSLGAPCVLASRSLSAPRRRAPATSRFAVQLPDRPISSTCASRRSPATRAGDALADAQYELARAYGFPSWPRLVRHVQALGLEGIERHLAVADPAGLAAVLATDPSAVDEPVDGLVPLLYLLRRSAGTGADVRECARVLLEAGADAERVHARGRGRRVGLLRRPERRRPRRRGADRAADRPRRRAGRGRALPRLRARRTALLEALWKPGAEHYVGHKVDFEDIEGLRWFLDRGADVNERCCLHHAIARGRSVRFIQADPRRGRRRRPALDVLGRRPPPARPRGALRASRGVRAARVARRDGRAGRRRRGRPRRRTRRVRRAPACPAAGARQPGDRRLRLDPGPVRAPRPHGDRPGAARRGWCTSTLAAGAISRRSTRPRCTAAARRSSC